MKTSKKCLNRITIALFVANLYLFSSVLTAQIQGIYFTADDFTHNKLSFAKGENKKCKIHIHDYLFNAHIKVTCGDSVYNFNKDSVFGFKDGDGISHRFFNKEVYTILNPTENILLYKVMVSAKTKYDPAVYSYRFSKDAYSPLYSLRTKNLEACFETNKIFIELLDVHFKNDGELLEYDDIHKMYKLNRLIELSKDQK